MTKPVLFLLALLVAVILIAPQIDLDPVVLPVQYAGSCIALLLIWTVMTRAASPLARSALAVCRYRTEFNVCGSPCSASFPLRC